ncbi:sugar O-acyltransferase (sialic acid O-acetyltransferase NeuD family) [Methylobacterium sp. BE186]|uniref:acetyltransferase n=1 Tax=Methylobacterium sp. BE186 TaxID=2817715 RepID=UPI00286481CF|nr:acetyltransferase [Methylobacterium sp. BE186]MDR7039667.1 sugar O-acyltransferase (sialic acid O-acetyltransferase NeuD family) [Methylobacterium sp. BE186]
MTTRVVLYGIGSPVAADVEESLHRAGLVLAAGIRNRPVESHLSDEAIILEPEGVGPDLVALPHLIPLFTPAHRQRAAREAAEAGFLRPFSLIDPSVAAPRRLDLGPGCYVNAGCSLGAASRFGAHVFVNRGASVGHHAQLSDFVSLGPGVVLAGHVALGRGSVVGAGATILPERSVGANAVVGAGAVVTRDVPEGCLVLGNPARIVRRDIGGYHGLPVT